jgi:predicted RNase H-like HicB family nuclease
MMEYVALIERAEDGSYSAFIPDLPGCVSCSDTLDEVRSLIREGAKLHLESLRSHGEPVPLPTTSAWTVHAG